MALFVAFSAEFTHKVGGAVEGILTVLVTGQQICRGLHYAIDREVRHARLEALHLFKQQ